MAYNTGNPSGSSDPRDLSDSSADIDTWATSTTADTHPDRLGVSRKTWRGMENEFDADQVARASEYAADKVYRDTTYNDAQADRAQRFDLFLANSGYQFVGDYAAGIELTEYNQVVRDVSGNLWRVSASTVLPYTTTGAGLPEGGAFIAIGDADLAQNLVSDPSTGQGALLVRGSVIYVDTIADLQALPTSELVDGQAVSVQGGIFRWNAAAGEFDPDSFVTPEMFGAVGDGVADDSSALTDALVYASSKGCQFKGKPTSIYRNASGVSVNREGHPPLTIDWLGAALYCDQAGLSVTGADNYLTTTLTADVARGASKIPVADVTGVAKGDQIAILSPAIVSSNGVTTHHYYVVSSVEGSDVFIDGTVVNDIKDSHIAATGATGSIAVYFRKLNTPLEMRNGKVLANDPSGTNTSIRIAHQYRTLVDNMEFQGHTRNQLYIQHSGYDTVRDCFFRDFGYVEGDTGYQSLAEHPSGLGYGYGIIHARNYMSRVVGCIGGKGWHLADASRGQMHITYDGCTSQRNGFGFSAHENAWNIEYINCKVLGQQGITAGRGHRLKMKNCHVGAGMRGHGLVVGGSLSEVEIVDCVFEMKLPTGDTSSSIYQDSSGSDITAASLSDGYTPYYSMKGCRHVGRCRITFGLGSSVATKVDVQVINNIFTDAHFYNLYSGTHLIFSNNKFLLGDEGEYYAANIRLPDRSAQIVNNALDITYSGAGTKVAFQLNGACNNLILLKNRSNRYLARFMSDNTSIRQASYNVVSQQIALGNSTNTIADATFNDVDTSIALGGVVVTNAAANVIDGVFVQ